MFNKVFCGAVVLALLSACSTVTIRPSGGEKVSSAPTYQDSKSYFFWGLAGTQEINVADICGGKKTTQMQSQYTFGDGFKSLITLGIYSPKTAKVWCE